MAFYMCSTWQRLAAAARPGTACWPSLHWCPGQHLHPLTPCPREALAAPASARGISPGQTAPLACFWRMEKLHCRWCHQHWHRHLMSHPCQSATCKSAGLPRHSTSEAVCVHAHCTANSAVNGTLSIWLHFMDMLDACCQGSCTVQV